MNNDELDSRLRSASPTGDNSVSENIFERATGSRRQRLSDWYSTSTPAARRNLGAGVAALAVAAIALPAAFPSTPALFSLAGSQPQSASSMVTNGELDSKMSSMPFVSYNYIAGPDLSAEPSTGTVFRLELVGEPQQRAQEIARVLGVTGTPAKSTYFDEAYPSWVVGPEDGTAPNVAVYWSGTGSWWYNNPAAYPAQDCIDPGQPGDVAGDDVSLECSAYEPPVTGLNPSASDALNDALNLFVALGYEGERSDLTVYRDEWGTTVTGHQSVGGQRVAIDWSMNWSGNGEIAYVSGHSARAIEAGSYPTVSAVDAVARLSDWRWFGAAPIDGAPAMWARSYSVGEDGAASDAAESTEPVDPDSPAEQETPAPEPTLEPAPVVTEPTDPGLTPEPLPTPTVIDLIITMAKPQLLVVWDSAGGAWLVPGFVMSGSEGWPVAVISLIDGIIELPEPMPIEPAIID